MILAARSQNISSVTSISTNPIISGEKPRLTFKEETFIHLRKRSCEDFLSANFTVWYDGTICEMYPFAMFPGQSRFSDHPASLHCRRHIMQPIWVLIACQTNVTKVSFQRLIASDKPFQRFDWVDWVCQVCMLTSLQRQKVAVLTSKRQGVWVGHVAGPI